MPLTIKSLTDRLISDGQEWILNNILLFHTSGSQMYGTSLPTSDHDYVLIYYSPRSKWITGEIPDCWQKRFEQFNSEVNFYDVRKWVKLIYGCNPNVIETLFVPDNCIVFQNVLWNLLRERGLKLLSRKVYFSFDGFSHSQMNKLLIKQSNKTGRRYITEEKGFDTKFAMHAFRIAAQGLELLKTGKITFPRPDIQNLLNIRNGITYDKNDTQKCVDDIGKGLERLKEVLDTSVLPDRVDDKEATDLLVKVFDMIWK